MSLDTMNPSEITAYMSRLRRTQAALIEAGEYTIAATVTPALRAARKRLIALQPVVIL